MQVNNGIQFDVPTDFIRVKEGFIAKKNLPERRSQRRIKQRSILRINSQFALLVDLSENGMKLSTYEVPETPAVIIDLTIEGHRYKLYGIIRWSNRGRTFSGLKNLGIYIIDPPTPYRQYINRLLQAEID